jgi:hypothetical protein
MFSRRHSPFWWFLAFNLLNRAATVLRLVAYERANGGAIETFQHRAERLRDRLANDLGREKTTNNQHAPMAMSYTYS